MMIRWGSVLMLLGVTIGCAVGPAAPNETAFNASSPEAFDGAWRSVTPALEFIGLSVASKSSEMGVLGARLTLSGVAWDGSGRIEGDSLVAAMVMVGASTTGGVLVAHVLDAHTLRVQFRPAGTVPIEVKFVRGD